MSLLNLSVSALAPRGLDASPATGGPSKLATSFDGEQCGTVVPHQPLPHALEVALRNSRFEQVMLNPQPLPPGPDGNVSHQGGRMALDDDWCGTRVPHQPLPHPLEVASYNSRFDQVMINPQPLPPEHGGNAFQLAGRAALDDDWCGTVVRHLPPPPPPVIDQIRQAFM
jgi:hypothetical protein